MTYSSSQAQAGRGTSISIGSTPTLIGEVTDIPLNRGKWETTEVTNFESGSDAEFLATIRKPGPITIKGNRVSSDAGQVAVEAAYQSGALAQFTVQLVKTSAQTSSGDKYVFNALVLNSDFSIQPSKEIAFSLDLQISGPTTFTAGS